MPLSPYVYNHLPDSDATNLNDALQKVVDAVKLGRKLRPLLEYQQWHDHRGAPDIKKGVLLLSDGKYGSFSYFTIYSCMYVEGTCLLLWLLLMRFTVMVSIVCISFCFVLLLLLEVMNIVLSGQRIAH